MNASNLIQYIKSCYIALGWSKIIQQDIQGKKEDNTKRNTVIVDFHLASIYIHGIQDINQSSKY